MPEQKPRRPRATRPEASPVETLSTPAESGVEPRCNLPGCGGTPEWRGLCSAHRQTHRGLADPKPVQYQPEALHTRERRDPEGTR